MSQESLRCVPISDFNLQNVCSYLENDNSTPSIECVETPFAQVSQLLVDPSSPVWSKEPDFALIWTQPQGVISSFRSLLDGEAVELKEILSQVEEFAHLIAGIEDRVRFTLIPLWTLPPYRQNHSLVGLNQDNGVDRALLEMNLKLIDSLASRTAFYLLNSPSWVARVGQEAYNPKLWYLAKIPFSNALLKAATAGVKSAVRGIVGNSRKLVIVDLDNTLWGGIVGDDGRENLRLGGHDAAGEAFVDFQQALLRLKRQGVILGIVSKNEEEIALDAIENHPEMKLGVDDFAGWRINWQDKAQNLVHLIDELNLGLDSVVFIDDNPVERDRVHTALPDVLVPDWPDDPVAFPSALESLDCFNIPTLSDEDRQRAEFYTSQRKRSHSRGDFESVDSWLGTLETVVTCEKLNQANLPRATQLLNKTNQMNMTTRRMSEAEFWQWSTLPHHYVWTFRVADKMGDLGLTGILSIEIEGDLGRIIDFVLSCRVMGRKIEETMIAQAWEHAQQSGLARLEARPIPTAKNAPCLRFWSASGFHRDSEDEPYSWPVATPLATPTQIQLLSPVTTD